MTAVLLPLYSNMACFRDEESVSRLERQIKSYLILYDEIYVEDGRLLVFASEDGQGMQFHMRSGSISESREEHSFFPPGQPFAFHVQDSATGDYLPVLSAENAESFGVDYYPVLSKAGLLNAPFVKRIEVAINDELKQQFDRTTSELYRSSPVRSELPKNSYIAKQTLFGFIRDSSVAEQNGIALSASDRLLPIINSQRTEFWRTWKPDIPGVFFDHWLELEFPDLTDASWEDVCTFRESQLGQSFRGLIRDMKARAIEFLQSGPTQNDIRYWVSKEFSKELSREVQSRLKSPSGVAINFCVNLLPYSQLTGTTKELLDCLRDCSSWVSIAKARPQE